MTGRTYRPDEMHVTFKCVNPDCDDRPIWSAKIGGVALAHEKVVAVTFEGDSPQNCPSCGRFGEMDG